MIAHRRNHVIAWQINAWIFVRKTLAELLQCVSLIIILINAYVLPDLNLTHIQISLALARGLVKTNLAILLLSAKTPNKGLYANVVQERLVCYFNVFKGNIIIYLKYV